MTNEEGHHHLADEMHVEAYMELKPHQPRYLCPYGCSKLIASRTIDYHKNNGCGRRLNDSIASHPELKKRFYCCGACFAEFVTRSEFHAHLRVEHDIHPEVHTLQFQNRACFDRFVRWLELEGGAHFRHKSGSKRRGRGKGIFLACNRSGYVNSEKTSVQDRTGPFRLGFTCTAYIHATQYQDGHVSAEVCGDHYGHDARMRLPTAVKYIIAQKQMEGVSPLEIMGFLRNHFVNLASENIFAQRVCFVDQDELKNIYVGSTKKWMKEGIPKDMEVWEEELLEKAHIVWPPERADEQFNVPRKPTTSEIAVHEQWPRPRVFPVKTRRDDGVMVPFDMATGEPMPAGPSEYGHDEEMDETRYIEMEMEYEDEAYVQEHQQIVVEEDVDGQRYPRIIKDEHIIEEGDVEVEVGNEVVVTSVDPENPIMDQKMVQRQSCVEEHVHLDSPTNEIVIVDGDGDDEIEHHHHHHHHHIIHDGQEQADPGTLEQRYIEVNKAEQVDQIMEEIEAFKHTVLKRAEHISSENLKSLLIRFQTLHQSIMEKDTNQPSVSMTVFPNRSKFMYRPGKGLEKSDQDLMNTRVGGDVTLQPIEDDISDDEEMMGTVADVVPFNACIWS